MDPIKNSRAHNDTHTNGSARNFTVRACGKKSKERIVSTKGLWPLTRSVLPHTDRGAQHISQLSQLAALAAFAAAVASTVMVPPGVPPLVYFLTVFVRGTKLKAQGETCGQGYVSKVITRVHIYISVISVCTYNIQ